ncbi:GH32 C-terminal domain-containing protein [Nocardiopsis xinjiangensis]|uniref:GH32 C-terminal domain-containing protein n=1 Tax=Nocardiopsis xinjiangensis TaxID=124285 RepID=UPI00034781A3|nr:GH32 C-terminal domain-containing protein [Nocardiopsis xinjiangensis]
MALPTSRTEHGTVDITSGFRARRTRALETGDGTVHLRVVDRSTVEVFGDRGQAVITDLVLPEAEEGTAYVSSLDVHGLE